jgi:predicted N-acetyltransferase YhbS
MNALIEKAMAEDLPEILTLQRQTFAPVAQAHGEPDIPPMTQTLGGITEEYQTMDFLKATLRGRIVGSVRTRIDKAGDCYIGRLIVLPEFQRRGIGAALMQAVHDAHPGCGFTLFTAQGGDAFRFYGKLGYRQESAQQLGNITMACMRRGSDST